MHRFLFTLTAICAASTLSARSLTGVYDISPEACASEFSDGRMEITPTKIQGMEGACDLTNPTSLRDLPNATLFDAVCSGEGMEWSYRVMLAVDYDGALLRYTNDGFWRYPRCN